jgi:uncharacterized phiE125 gp8 family phage protein
VAFVLVAPPEAEPLTAAEAEEHLRLEAGQGGAAVARLIRTARQHVERVTSRALVTQTWELVLDRFPSSSEIRLGKGSLLEVASVKYLAAAGALEQTLAAAEYQVDTARVPGRIVRVPGSSWPATADRINAVRVQFDVGFGEAAAVPEPIRAAMLLLVGHLYEHRESEIVGTITSPLQFAVNALLAPYVLHGV